MQNRNKKYTRKYRLGGSPKKYKSKSPKKSSSKSPKRSSSKSPKRSSSKSPKRRPRSPGRLTRKLSPRTAAKKIQSKFKELEECPICYEKLFKSDSSFKLTCDPKTNKGHTFHPKCIYKWIENTHKKVNLI